MYCASDTVVCFPPSSSVEVPEKNTKEAEVRLWEAKSMVCHFDIYVEKLYMRDSFICQTDR